jgi:O-antigen/teichoic acid export membrane protein
MRKIDPEQPHTFSLSTFISDLSLVGSANVGVFVLGVIQGLIIPKILTVEDYGYWKLFLLYTGFSGLLHLGFTDGVYLDWAGKQMKDLAGIIRYAFRVLFIHLSIISTILLIGFLYLDFANRNISLLALVYAFILNLLAFSQFTFQAARKFRIVSILSFIRPLIFLSSIGFLYVLKILNHEKVIFVYIGACFLIFLIYFHFLKEAIKSPCRIELHYWNVLLKYIKSGWPLLFGNFIVFLILNADVMIVGALFSINKFAFYAFAITILGIFSIFTNTISTVIFPHLAVAPEEIKNKAYSLSSSLIVLIWGIILGIYPLAAIFISFFLPNYSETLPYIKVLMLTVGFITTIQILHNNYYKLYFLQTRYFLSTFVISLMSFAAIFVVAKYTYDLLAIAFVKVAILFIWFIVNELLLMGHIKQTLFSILKRIIIIFIFSVIFMISLYFELAVLQVVFYYFMFSISCLFLLKNEILNLNKLRNVK